MSAAHQIDELYVELARTALSYGTPEECLQRANLAYINVRMLFIKAKLSDEWIPNLKKAIRELPGNLANAFGIGEHDALWNDCMALPGRLMIIIGVVLDFEHADA